jgi:polygalacturonase
VIDRRSLLLGGSATALWAAAPAFARTATDPWAKARQIVRGIERPRIGRRRLRLEPPANGDIRAAIHAAMRQLGSKGGTIVVPKGEWLSNGPIHFKSRIALDIPEATHLKFSSEPEHYLPLVFTRWEGTECWNYSPLIYARDVTDIAITGKGIIDGQGFEGFFKWRPQQRDSQQLLRKMGADGVPVDQRRFGPGHYLRPGFVQFVNCQRVLIDGPRLIDSTFWIIHPVYCNHVTVRNISLKSDHLNSDGVDPDSSTNVLIERCIFDVGDDGVSIKAGRDQDGWRVARPSSRIVVRDCEYRGSAGGGFAIGSEMSGGVCDVFVERYTMGTVVHGAYFKSNMDRGGAITDIFIRDITIGSAQAAISFTTDYHGYRGGNFPTKFDNVTIENLACAEATVGLSFVGAINAPLGRIRVANSVIGKAKTQLRSRNATALTFDNVLVNGMIAVPAVNTGPETFLDTLKS